ncbi:MAG TPA: hypothetical protein VFD39_14060 [Trueperaceae bacterium]|nr:hypothetical protein [Trueperaceae bacterium]
MCLEDVIEFLIKDLDVPGHDGWQAVVEQGRERWYHRQLGAAIRSNQDAAVAVLEELGYTVSSGED